MKHWKVNNKIIAALSAVLIVFIALSSAFVVTFMNVSDANVSLTTATSTVEELLLRTSVDIMDMRRLVGMIHAFNGNEEQIDGYQADFNTAYESANSNLAAISGVAGVREEDKAMLSGAVSEMQDLISQYKTLLFDPNVESAKRSDIEALNAANQQYGSLISSVNEYINTLIAEAKALQASGITEADATVNSLVITFAIAILVIVGLSMVFAIFVSNHLSKPLVPFTEYMNRAGTLGELEPTQEDMKVIGKHGSRRDEIGQLLVAGAKFFERSRDISVILSRVSTGDLTANTQPLSQNDIMGNALNTMTRNLSDMFGSINASSIQVTSGANQIADGSQSLAQGTTEQAASIEQLSSSISEISERTKHNAEMAGKTAQLTDTIKSNAEKGSAQMNEMISAVREIHTSSQTISKVMKTIDDIAFQTNILALNAAVEAARAGQHGKGFAVVAEEVRNLASKSADAARETETLIADSLGKAELGVRIAGDTASSLTEIVSGVNESSQLVTEIAKECEAQSQGISQINTGIDQVAQVVQQNSATAQQSAAASQEMSGQSEILRNLIAKFKINEEQASLQENTLKFTPRSAEPAIADELDNSYGKY